jgi:hypothetical protein
MFKSTLVVAMVSSSHYLLKLIIEPIERCPFLRSAALFRLSPVPSSQAQALVEGGTCGRKIPIFFSNENMVEMEIGGNVLFF